MTHQDLTKKVIQKLSNSTIIPAKDIVRAVTPPCKKALSHGFKNPVFRVDSDSLKIIPDNSDSKYNITWGGHYADYDQKNLESLVHKGDKVTVTFYGKDGDIGGDIILDTQTMKTSIDYEPQYLITD